MPRTRHALLTALLASLASTACEPPQPETPTPPEPPAPTATATAAPALPVVNTSLDAVGLDPAALDRSVDPCQDFYQFACGGWIAKVELPADKPRHSRGFSVISDRNEEALHTILEDAAKAKDPATEKIGAYYGACMDEKALEAQKLKPVEPLLKLIKKVRDNKTLLAAVVELHKHKIWPLFDISEEQDFKDATRVIAEIDQSGLGLPDRDYYLSEDATKKKIKGAYAEHVERVFALSGANAKAAKHAASDVMKIETEIAKVSKSRVERRDPTGMYNKIDRPGLAKAAPHFAWDEYFKEIGFPAINDVTVTSVPFFEGVDRLLTSAKPSEWQSYLTWHVLHSMTDALPKAFADEAFRMEATLTGQKEQRVRWKRCVGSTDGALGELLAQPFVKAHFTPAAKEATERYVHQISDAFSKELGTLDWMDAATKEKAYEKLRAMAYLIGYPNKWRVYDFEVKPGQHAANLLAARAFDFRRRLRKIGKPVDREEWGMTPPTVNAYYRGTMNHMVFPAGILQPPFFNVSAAIPVNLGAIGMVVGHELTHGFDDKGSQFDAKGNLHNWWTDDVRAKFKAKTDCVDKQYSGYEPIPGVKLNGQLTLGENIADNAGVKLAFRAYRALRKDAKDAQVASGFTEDQQFFLGVGQVWCTKQTDEFTRLRASTDTHSPPRFRVNGPLSNLPEFAEAFQCKEGAPMRRPSACTVW
jgi:putative endopeptidase